MARKNATPEVDARAVLCARMANEKHAKGILILDLLEIEGAPANYFVIASVESVAQMKAVVEAVQDSMKLTNNETARKDALGDTQWAVLDYFDIIVHVMDTELREFYNLERLWGDARAFGITNEGAPHQLSTVPRRSATS